MNSIFMTGVVEEGATQLLEQGVLGIVTVILMGAISWITLNYINSLKSQYKALEQRTERLEESFDQKEDFFYKSLEEFNKTTKEFRSMGHTLADLKDAQKDMTWQVKILADQIARLDQRQQARYDYQLQHDNDRNGDRTNE